MAFISGHMASAEKTKEVINRQFNSSNDLDKLELEFLLRVLADVTLKGKEVEMFYNLVIKLQQQYINKQ